MDDVPWAVLGSQTQPALFIITTKAPNFMPTPSQTCSHSVTRSLGVVREVALAVSQPLNSRSTEAIQKNADFIDPLEVRPTLRSEDSGDQPKRDAPRHSKPLTGL